jgi:hypothetical protein
MKTQTQIDAAQSAASIWVLCSKQNFHCYIALFKQTSVPDLETLYYKKSHRKVAFLLG